MANMRNSTTTGANGVYADPSHAENPAFRTESKEQPFEKEREELQSTSPIDPVSNTDTSHETAGDVNETMNAGQQEILAARGFRRIILNFTPS